MKTSPEEVENDRTEVSEAGTASLRGAAAIATELRKAILEGRYQDRERLPAERDLAAQYRASRSTVREALRQLEQANLVSRRVGSGTFVIYNQARKLGLDEDIADITSPLELIEVRRAVEPEMAALAVVHAAGRDIERLREALERVERCGDSDSFTRADAQFHQVLAECTSNPLMIWLYAHINEVRGHSQWNAMKDKILTSESIAAYNKQHRELFEAIVRRDREAAVRAISSHLEKARRDLVGAGASGG